MGLLNKIELKENLGNEESEIVTDIDRMQSIVVKYGSISLKDIAVILRTDVKRVEELARVLNKYAIAELYYPPIGEPLVRKLNSDLGNKKSFTKPRLSVAFGVLLVISIAVIAALRIYGVL